MIFPELHSVQNDHDVTIFSVLQRSGKYGVLFFISSDRYRKNLTQHFQFPTYRSQGHVEGLHDFSLHR